MECFPIFSGHHFDGIPGTAIEECSIRSFADAFLTADAKVGIDLNAPEGRVILIRHPEHTCLDGAVLDACRRSRATGAAISSDRQNSGLFLASRLTVANRHGPIFFYNVIHYRSSPSYTIVSSPSLVCSKRSQCDSNIALLISSTICVGDLLCLMTCANRTKR